MNGELTVNVTTSLFNGAVIGRDDGLIPSLDNVCQTVTVNGYLGTAVGASCEPSFLASVRLVCHGSLHVIMCSIEQIASFIKDDQLDKHIEMMGELNEEKMKALPKGMLYQGCVAKGQVLITPPGYVTLWASANLENCAFIRTQFVPRGGRGDHENLVRCAIKSSSDESKEQQQSLLDLLGSSSKV
jgi:hypothetical protein